MNSCQKYFSAGLLALLSQAAFAQAPNLGAASGFAVLGDTAVTCTSSVVIGDVGVSSNTGVFTNTGCSIAGGTPPATNTAAAQARTDFLSAYAYAANALQSGPCTTISGNLAGRNLGPGVYCLDAVAKAGTLTLTGTGGSNEFWIFRVAGALTGTNFTVVMAGGGQACNVFWAPSDAVTMTTSTFIGNILAGGAALGSITLTGGTLAGRALANIAVTMTTASAGVGAGVIGCGAPGAAALLNPLASCKVKKGKKGNGGNDDDDDDDDDEEHNKKNKKKPGHTPKSPWHK